MKIETKISSQKVVPDNPFFVEKHEIPLAKMKAGGAPPPVVFRDPAPHANRV